MDSTVLGDAVNLASRLEGLTKFYGCSLIISDTTMQLLDTERRHLARELDRVRVKGRLASLHIYEIFDGDELRLREAKLKSRDDLVEGLRLYRDRQWNDALVCFDNCARICPTDPLARIYRDRCNHNSAKPPPPEWDGVYEFDHK